MSMSIQYAFPYYALCTTVSVSTVEKNMNGMNHSSYDSFFSSSTASPGQSSLMLPCDVNMTCLNVRNVPASRLLSVHYYNYDERT